MRANRGDDLVLARGDRQLGWVRRGWNIEPALLPQGQGSVNLLAQPLQQCLALVGVMTIAQKPGEPPPQPHPVGQQALRQQRL